MPADEPAAHAETEPNPGTPQAATAEGEERPVREKLKHAAISSVRGSQSPESSDVEMRQHTPPEEEDEASAYKANGRARPARKRSLEDLKDTEHGTTSLDAPLTPSSGTHARKKSKEQTSASSKGAAGHRNVESTIPEEREGDEEDGPDAIGQDEEGPGTPSSGANQPDISSTMSPRKKRSAEEMGSETSRGQKIIVTEEAQKARKSLDEDRPNVSDAASAAAAAAAASEKPDDAGDKADPEPAAVIPKSSGFANASASSPFTSLGAPATARDKDAPKPPNAAAGFERSGFSKLTGDKSPFGAFGSNGAKAPVSPPSAFGLFANGPAASAGSKIGFGATSTTFGSGSSGFGGAAGGSSLSGGSGFGSGKLSSFASAKGDLSAPPAGAKLTSFAKPGGGDLATTTTKSSLMTAQASKPFGATTAQENSDEEDDDDGEEASTVGDEVETRNDDEAGKYHIIEDVTTGEEGEDSVFVNRAKLYMFTEGAWKERGTGVFKLNRKTATATSTSVSHPDREADLESATGASEEPISRNDTPNDGTEGDRITAAAEAAVTAATTMTGPELSIEVDESYRADDAGQSQNQDGGSGGGKARARFLMRAIATHRVILNAPVFKQMLIGDPRDTSKPPSGKQLLFGVPEDGRMTNYLLKIGREEELAKLYTAVKAIQEQL